MDSDSDGEKKKKEEAKKKPAPKKLEKKEGEDDFKANLAAMLARGPSQITRMPAASRPVTQAESQDQLIEARLDMPKVNRSRGVTTKYNIDKFDFDGF